MSGGTEKARSEHERNIGEALRREDRIRRLIVPDNPDGLGHKEKIKDQEDERHDSSATKRRRGLNSTVDKGKDTP